MKRIAVIAAVAVLTGAIISCDGLLPDPATPLEQVEGFIVAANRAPQNPSEMKAYFDPSAADYGSMQLSTYWESRFFAQDDQPFGLINAQAGSEDPEFANSVTVTAYITNSINTTDGYPATFVLVADPDNLFADPLIRKITVTVDTTDEVIEKIVP